MSGLARESPLPVPRASGFTNTPIMEPPSFPSPRPKAKPPPTPQALVSKFWSKYHNKSPSRVTAIFPRSLYASLLPNTDVSQSRARNAASSYQEARADCRARVRAIVAECERTNSKFTDPDFDIEGDFHYQMNNCLFGLIRKFTPDDDSDSDDEKPRDKILPWQVEMSLDTLRKSGMLGNEKLQLDPSKFRHYINDFASLSEESRRTPGSVHRLPWIFENPQFTVDGFSSTDVKQGSTGDCWWLAALATIAHRKDLMNKVCVERDEECGVYGFVFNRDGEWISTVIDDNLYLKYSDFGSESDIYDSTGKKARRYKKEKQTGSDALYFAKCEDADETWLPLVEKAFAKVHGDYEALHGGWSGNAVEDLTGGVTTVIAGNKVLRKERLWREFASCGTEEGDFVFGISPSVQTSDDKRNGIMLHHAYSLLRAVEVEDEDGKRFKLVKVRNPWGEKNSRGQGEWHGPWSDGSREWTSYMIQKLRHKFGDDGTFWMTYDDLLANFKWIYRTRLFDQTWTVTQKWTSIRVAWLTGFLKKKFVVEVKEAGMVVIVLTQLDTSYFRDLVGQYDFHLQFLLKPMASETPLCKVRALQRGDRRSINCELNLEAGTYEVIPSVSADRCSHRPTVEQVVKVYADANPEKLRQVGLQYDLAHAKSGVLDEEEELQRRRESARRKRRKQKQKAKQANPVEDAMKRVEDALLHMRIEIARNGSGGGEKKDKDEANTDKGKKKTEEKDSSAEVAPPKPTLDTSVQESPAKGTAVVVPSKTQSEQPSPETNDKTDDKEAPVPTTNPTSSSSQSLPTSQTDISAENEAPRPEFQDVLPREVPVKDDSSSDPGSDPGSESDSSSDSDSDLSDADMMPGCEYGKWTPWNAVCVVGLRVYAQQADIELRVEEERDGKARSDLVTKDGNPVGPTS